MTDAVLDLLDADRRGTGVPDPEAGVVREVSADGAECRITYATGKADIDAEVARAAAAGYALEWKVYGHNVPADLGARLAAAGLAAEPVEQVLVLPLTSAALTAVGPARHEVRRVQDEAGLRDVAAISREIGRSGADEEAQRLAAVLRASPEALSVYVAYAEGLPAACGRAHYRPGGAFAELAGGRTRTTHRRRGLFTDVVGARLAEAHRRGRRFAVVDALPTSAPTLLRLGFLPLTTTQPYTHPVPR